MSFITYPVIFGDASTGNIKAVDPGDATYLPGTAITDGAEVLSLVMAGSVPTIPVAMTDTSGNHIDSLEIVAGADPFGANADAAVAAGAAGSISAKLRRITQGLEDLKTLVVLAASSNVIGAVTQSGTWNVGTVSTITSLSQLGGQAIALNAGNASAGTPRVVIATDQATLPVTLKPATTGGTSMSRAVSAATDNPTLVKNSAGHIYSAFITNNGTTARYFKLYNKASAPSSADTPIFSAMVPAGAGIHPKFPLGLACSLGIGYRLVSGIADADNTAAAASECLINVEYN